MKTQTNKPTSVEQLKLSSSFEALREKLKQDKFVGMHDHPLAHWALPSDRRLPLALLGWTLSELINTSFDELSATPGIGQKKIASLMKLLERAAAAETKKKKNVTYVEVSANGPGELEALYNGDDFNSSIVSESLWSDWRQTVRNHSVRYELLGRLTPSLQSLPTVIWKRRLDYYVDRPLAEIRQLKTHGEKRVSAILEVFANVHYAISTMQQAAKMGAAPRRLKLRLIPEFIEPVELWVRSMLYGNSVPKAEEVLRNLAAPLVRQVRIDLGEVIAGIVDERLGLSGPPKSVRHQARQMDLTRARIYQLLEEVERIMEVRWPEGKPQLLALERKLSGARKVNEEMLRTFQSTRELFFPDQPASLGPQLKKLEMASQNEPMMAF